MRQHYYSGEIAILESISVLVFGFSTIHIFFMCSNNAIMDPTPKTWQLQFTTWLIIFAKLSI